MKTQFSILCILTLGLSCLASETLETVIAKHIKAKGGAANWAKIDALKFTGTYTGFSISGSFTLIRAKGSRYLFDYTLNKKKMHEVWDGKQAWWLDSWMEMPVTTAMVGPDYQVMVQRAELATPLFDYAERGFKVTYKGAGEVEGTPTLVLEVERSENHKETWHLDPDTYLEYARVGPGSDFGRPVPQVSFFDDFRDVQGVMIPFFTEDQFHTRNRILEIENVVVNPDLPEDTFGWPAEPNMVPLQIMAGKWKVKVEERSFPSQPWRESETTATIAPNIRGNLLQERIMIGGPDDASEHIRQWTYDPFRQTYVITQMNDFTTHLNIFKGKMEEGVLKVDNLESNTPWQAYGRTFHEGLQWHPEGGGFVIEMVRSQDGGQNWFVNKKFTYTQP